MDRVEKYRQVLEKIVRRHASFVAANGQIETTAVCDHQADEYFVIDSGWNEKGRRIHDVVLHFRLRDGKVLVEHDGTDAEIARELVENGIAPDDIVLAFNPAPYRQFSDLLAA